MSWQGANVVQREDSPRESRPAEETVEAALNRLSKAYHTAMTCVGAWHRVSFVESDIGQLRQVGQAARKVFEEAICRDPWIADTHAPLLNQTLPHLTSRRKKTVELRSTGHQQTVEKLAYLSLVNYADLLLAGCGGTPASPRILDRGVVQPLAPFRADTAWIEMVPGQTLVTDTRNGSEISKAPDNSSNDAPFQQGALDASDATNQQPVENRGSSNTTLVPESILKEPESVTVRLALVAYLDATSIDDTDPTVWLKLACAARRLGRPLSHPAYRHLEKFALEQAVSALPAGIPPNRLAQRALEEWEKEDETNAGMEYVADLKEKHEFLQVVDIPVLRYSWSHVGRTLLRLCSEGSHQEGLPILCSPNFSLKLSPLLALPANVLGGICLFLQPADIYRFEATCHALSSAIVAARAAIDHQAVRRESLSHVAKDSTTDKPQKVAVSEVTSETTETKVEEKAPVNRISKRVRSQIITSGKRAERENRRSSTKFCLLSAIFGCTEDSEEYQAAVKAGHASLAAYSRALGQVDSSNNVFRKHGRIRSPSLSSDYSLFDFVQASVDRPQSSIELLCDFVSKVAMNVADVFQNDHSSYVLSAIILECFEVICQVMDYDEGRNVCWSNAPAGPFFELGLLGLFAVDLLDAELSLLKCEQDGCVYDATFNGYRNVVMSKAPCLIAKIPILEAKLGTECCRSKKWVHLKARCFWVTAGVYLWQGRLSNNVTDSREAENRGLEAIQEVMKCLEAFPLQPVLTPHLVSPSRKGQVWKELTISSLSNFKNDVQASSILLQTEERFLQVIATMNEMESDQLLTREHVASLETIGSELLERYAGQGSNGLDKHAELVADLLNEHGVAFLSSAIWDNPDKGLDKDEWFQTVVPIDHIETVGYFLNLQRPCLLTILLSCLQTKADRNLDVLNLLVRVCSSITAMWEDVQVQIGESSEEIWSKKVECDSDDESLDDYQERALAGENESKRSRLRQYSVLYRFLIGRIALLCEVDGSKDKLDCIASNKIICAGSKQTLMWSQAFDSQDFKEGDFVEDIRLFRAMQHLERTLQGKQTELCESKKLLERAYVSGMIELICQQRKIIEKVMTADCDRNQRSLRSRIIRRRCELVELVCCDLGLILSESNVFVADLQIVRSALISKSNIGNSCIAALCESLLWIWGSVSGTLVDNQSTAERLKVATACVLVGLCGSASSSQGMFRGSFEAERTLQLDEFYDSDSSTTDWLVGSDGETDSTNLKSVDLLRVIIQVVHCIANVYSSVDEKEVAALTYSYGHNEKVCPVLPVIVVRVLHHFADILLNYFAEEEKAPSVWSQYPLGIRSTGQLLDSLLHKAYRILYGFSLSHENKDAQSGPAPVNDKSRYSLPESASAAVSLYRCVLRTYSQGRRSPPKCALEAILAVLPPAADTTKATDFRKFLFSKDGPRLATNEWCSFVKQPEDFSSHFRDIERWIDVSRAGGETVEEDEMTIVRRGASNFLAQSNISPNYEVGAEEDRRLIAVLMEEENAKKFFALFDGLCLGQASDFESWFAAAQCLLVKADTIADRLGLTKGFGRICDFTPSASKIDQEKKSTFEQMLEEQSCERSLAEQGWLQCLGTDLSVYVSYTWSSLESLKLLSEAVLSGYREDFKQLRNNDEAPPFDLHVWSEIEHLRLKSDYDAWQNAWGGLFVSALRNIASRCAQLAVYTLHKRRAGVDLQIELSEIMESMGIFFYTDLMASQLYGYPMRLLTPYSKRQIGETSLACFERSIETASSNEEVLRTSWDLKLMMGKCHEKIANTLWSEEYPNDSSRARKYEYHLSKALEAYNASIVEAKALESSNELIVEGSGGSSHGSAESVYRLHASRLKCLIRALKTHEDLRDLAEQEALRIVECFWYAKEPDFDPQLNVRDRVWNVLVDIVTAMAQFRHDFPYFHRSVYRHAQALMWAPIFHDPVGQRSSGSLGTVPAAKASRLRGLNYLTNAAYSGFMVMSSLFEKKRQQLCAVWVTRDSSESAFSALNSSIRKYDSLRGKYTNAYLESLCLCDCRSELETFLKWVYSCKRDLPSYFSASASIDADKLKKSHTHDCLLVKPRALSSLHFLTTIKRETNRALAITILNELKKPPGRDGVASYEDLLQLAYSCYLRLNCKIDDLTKGSSWRYKKSGAKEVINALTTAYLRLNKGTQHSDQSADWNGETFSSSVLLDAIRKCQQLFPSHSGGFLHTKKKTAKQKEEAGVKRKGAPSDEKRPFEVTIPDGLSAGDSFVTSIQDGDKVKKVRLTVPEGANHTLRFHL
ncbi:hypothetical protein FisN_8Lh139 [Fistulifera solaris]|uniref:Separase n=1 Tax=Fistulifera solaris TaxID=1519565 RepID=A0A1Z5JDI9_FISSO|nr:hypothetical protein FisN_8Lh139 [Fistulifera solaris]|eukprot:GAX12039.1 hypothetical protein FisN_8Lh139 [Fistulifera solaris]